MEKKVVVYYKVEVEKCKDIVVRQEHPIPKWCVEEKECCICQYGILERNDGQEIVIAMKGSDGVYYRHMGCDVGQ